MKDLRDNALDDPQLNADGSLEQEERQDHLQFGPKESADRGLVQPSIGH